MRTGVKRNRYFIAYLTKDYLIRPFCRKEIRWALAYNKTIILLWKREGNGAVGRFQDFFDACKVSVDNDNGALDMLSMFGDAAINYYPRGDFHSASMSELAGKLGSPMETDCQHMYDFVRRTPRVLLAFSQVDGQQQMQAIERRLGQMCPALDGEFGLLDVESTNAGSDSCIIVYLTENIWTHDDTSILDALVAATRVSATVVLVADTDMAHGWKSYCDAQWVLYEAQKIDAAARGLPEPPEPNVSWSEAVNYLQNDRTPVEYFEQQDGLNQGMFDAVIPYYLDKAFRQVSLQMILEELGAEPGEPIVDASPGARMTPRISRSPSASSRTDSRDFRQAFTQQLRDSEGTSSNESTGPTVVGLSRPASPARGSASAFLSVPVEPEPENEMEDELGRALTASMSESWR
eukprot:COSAG02_NODE_380_length_23483_cov_8.034382_19_plen_406_part_00